MGSSIVLTSEDLHTLTGYERPTHQRKWLDRNGIKYFVAADGRPSVLYESVFGAINDSYESKSKKNTWELKF